MKLIIQIPCYNEEETLPLVFDKMPREIAGIDEIEFQIIDDGSTDKTVEIAKSLGIKHIVKSGNTNRRWLGRAFRVGVDNALKNNADILVNTDGDNQYPSEQIPELIKPILENKADVVIGDRNPGRHPEFSLLKRILQRVGSRTVQMLSDAEVKDAVSGFRAYSRNALFKINVITNFTYTVDTLMQANHKGLDVFWLPIKPNAKTRESHLIKGLYDKVKKSGSTILRLYTIYQPFRTFLLIAFILAIPGLFFLFRFLYFYAFVPEQASGHVQSLIAGAILVLSSIQMVVLGVIGDLLSVNRRLIEDALTRIRRLESRKD